MSDYDETRLQFATDLARRAGDLGMRYFRSFDTLTVESKGHQDLVSEADRNVESFIRAAIAERYPLDGIVGEEHAPTVGTSGYDWVIDPIDGTANFVRGIPAWTVVIACCLDNIAMVGVIHEPSTNECFYGRRGGGAQLNGKPMRTTSATSLTQGSVGVGSSNRAPAANVVKVVDLVFAEGGVFFRNASGALMLAYVASGRLLGYVEQHMNAWDCVAGLLLIEEAGGRVLQPPPDTVLADGTVVIAGGAGIFDTLRSISQQAYGIRI